MKTKVCLFFSLILLLSCNNNDYEDQVQTKSGTIEESNNEQIINVGGKQITVSFTKDSIDDDVRLSLRSGLVGPYYAYGNMALIAQNQKIIVSGESSVPAGVYICEIYSFTKTIKLAPDEITAKVEFPSPAGYNNYSTQTKGVNWTMSTDANGSSLSFTFYTLRLMYDMAGRQIGHVIPSDGRNIRIPYYIFKL